jgi:hypothetical protein
MAGAKRQAMALGGGAVVCAKILELLNRIILIENKRREHVFELEMKGYPFPITEIITSK